MRIDFHGSAEPTLGVEWEFALVDRRTRDLRNDAAHLFARAKARLSNPARLHKELLKNTVEIVTGVCANVPEAMADLRRTLEVVVPAGDDLGLDLYGAGTHPFASWTAQELTEGHRYEELINRTQWWGRQMLIWGVHVHVGMPEQSRVMPVLSSLLNHYPHLQALSASSPIWAGVDTGYASNRALMFQQLPTAGLPFQFSTWEEFEAYVGDQVTTGVIEELNEVRWDVRPAPHLGTLENRVCDGVSTFADLAALVALMHCLVVDLDSRLAAGRDAAGDAAVARAGEQVARRPLRPRRDRHPRRGVQRAADHRRPRGPGRAAGPGRPSGWAAAAELASVLDIATRGASYQRQRAVAARDRRRPGRGRRLGRAGAAPELRAQ